VGERGALRHPFQVVPAGEVEQLDGRGRHRKGRHQIVERVRLRRQIAHQGPGPQQPGGEQLEGQGQVEAPGVVRRPELQPAGATGPETGDRPAVQGDRGGHEGGGPAGTGERSAEPGPPGPAGAVLGQQRHPRMRLDVVRSDRRRARPDQRPRLRGVETGQLGTPVGDHRQPAGAGVDQDRDTCRAERDDRVAVEPHTPAPC
jgi:hypothetical protein